MKIIKNSIKITLSLLFILVACTEDLRDTSFVDDITAPANVSAVYNITQDNSGSVTITPNADGAVSYEVFFGDGTAAPAIVSQGGSAKHVYAEGNYNIKVVAVNLNKVKTEVSQQLIVSFKAPQNLVVVIENDAAVSKKVNITANADFATMFEFSSGETGVTQPVVSGNIGQTISYTYQNAGTYDVSVEAKGGAIQTTKFDESFVVTEILAPTIAASAPPARSASDVISIYTDAGYNNVAGTDTFPDWGQAGQGSSWAEFNLNGNKMLQYVNLSYQGIQFGSVQDVSNMEFLHMDVWTSNVSRIETSLISVSNGEKPVWSTLTANQWTTIDIPISAFTNQGLTVADIQQLKFVGDPWAAGTVFIDNIYFYKQSSASTFDDGLLTNGDFQAGSNSWIVGVDDNAPAPVAVDGANIYYSVNVSNAGNPWEVNLSQKVEIVNGTTYTLTFDAWSNVTRSMIAGIGLSADPWSNKTETLNITPSRATYKYTFTADFGATNARVLFDLGAAAGQVNIDNVSLFKGNGNKVLNGNFENGSAPWIVGVDDNAPAPIGLTNGNNHYFVNVTNAGNPWEVNLSQKLLIVNGATYVLTFDAWSNVNRTIVAGIGLSADPWSNKVETVNINTNRTTYTYTFTANFGATNARVLFDSGAAVGEVNIDNVSLSRN